MAIGNRFNPSHSPADIVLYCMDFSNILPLGVGIADSRLAQYLNTNPAIPTNDFTVGAIEIIDRRVYAQLAGGNSGVDYQLRWTATDSLGNNWQRTALLLCAPTD